MADLWDNPAGADGFEFIEDDDEVILRGRCEKDGCMPIGCGEAAGRVCAPSMACA